MPAAVEVKLADNIAVAPELAAGAQTFSPEEAALMFRPRLSKPLMALAAGVLVLLGGLTWGAISLAQADAPPAPKPIQHPVTAAAAKPAPAPAAEPVVTAPVMIEDELAPLDPNARPAARVARKAAPKASTKTVARSDVAKDPQPEQFEFLEEKAPPKEELKRPTF
jgi:hypothetical protein